MISLLAAFNGQLAGCVPLSAGSFLTLVFILSALFCFWLIPLAS